MSLDELPLNEWVVIFYPTTGAARLCPTLDFARNVAKSTLTFNKHVYRSPNDFRTRHDHHELERSWVELYKTAAWRFPKTATGHIENYTKTPPDVDTETFCKLLWEFIQDVGDRLTVPQITGSKAETKEQYQLKLGAMRQLMEDEDAYKKKYNNQARIVFEALYNNYEEFLNENEIKKIILNLVAQRKLKTKQEPWTIFQYYRPQFIKDGYVIRGRAPKK